MKSLCSWGPPILGVVRIVKSSDFVVDPFGVLVVDDYDTSVFYFGFEVIRVRRPISPTAPQHFYREARCHAGIGIGARQKEQHWVLQDRRLLCRRCAGRADQRRRGCKKQCKVPACGFKSAHLYSPRVKETPLRAKSRKQMGSMPCLPHMHKSFYYSQFSNAPEYVSLIAETNSSFPSRLNGRPLHREVLRRAPTAPKSALQFMSEVTKRFCALLHRLTDTSPRSSNRMPFELA